LLTKYARSIGGKLNQRHACIPAIEIFVLAEKSIVLPQIPNFVRDDKI